MGNFWNENVERTIRFAVKDWVVTKRSKSIEVSLREIRLELRLPHNVWKEQNTWHMSTRYSDASRLNNLAHESIGSSNSLYALESWYLLINHSSSGKTTETQRKPPRAYQDCNLCLFVLASSYRLISNTFWCFISHHGNFEVWILWYSAIILRVWASI